MRFNGLTKSRPASCDLPSSSLIFQICPPLETPTQSVPKLAVKVWVLKIVCKPSTQLTGAHALKATSSSRQKSNASTDVSQNRPKSSRVARNTAKYVCRRERPMKNSPRSTSPPHSTTAWGKNKIPGAEPPSHSHTKTRG